MENRTKKNVTVILLIIALVTSGMTINAYKGVVAADTRSKEAAEAAARASDAGVAAGLFGLATGGVGLLLGGAAIGAAAAAQDEANIAAEAAANAILEFRRITLLTLVSWTLLLGWIYYPSSEGTREELIGADNSLGGTSEEEKPVNTETIISPIEHKTRRTTIEREIVEDDIPIFSVKEFPESCPHCGSTSFSGIDNNSIKCSHCDSIIRRSTQIV